MAFEGGNGFLKGKPLKAKEEAEAAKGGLQPFKLGADAKPACGVWPMSPCAAPDEPKTYPEEVDVVADQPPAKATGKAGSKKAALFAKNNAKGKSSPAPGVDEGQSAEAALPKTDGDKAAAEAAEIERRRLAKVAPDGVHPSFPGAAGPQGNSEGKTYSEDETRGLVRTAAVGTLVVVGVVGVLVGVGYLVGRIRRKG